METEPPSDDTPGGGGAQQPLTQEEIDLLGRDSTPDAAILEEGADEALRTLSLAGWNAGNIISDSVFFASDTMSAADVQSFLNSKGNACQSGYVCLKDYRQSTPTRAADKYCPSDYAGASNETAATIIAKVARACGINPQVLLVVLQKEQSLVTRANPGASVYKIAMGYACPDTAPCDERYYGFFNQVYSAARQFKVYGMVSGFRHNAGQTVDVYYHPNAGCGTSRVYIANKATAALYNYTPYQPNAAALAAGWGLGDGCSSYGNRNFYNYFTDWFGSTQHLTVNPVGAIDSWESIPGGVRLTGWALDPNTTGFVSLRIKSGSLVVARANANLESSTIPAQYQSYGTNHGFSVDVRLPAGTQQLCVAVNNIGAGSNSTIGCPTVRADGGDVFGAVESWSKIPGGVRITGWAIDPDSTGAVSLRVKSGDLLVRRANADLPSATAQSLYPAFGGNRGYSVDVVLAPGQQTICVAANNVGVGSNRTLGCFDVSPPGGRPIGAVEAVELIPGGVRVRGWAIDPDTTDAVTIRVKSGANTAAYATADRNRPDIEAAYPAFGAARGFEAEVQLPAGLQDLCIVANNVGEGSHSFFSCQKLEPMTGTPIGYVNNWIPIPGGVKLTGWTIDPDTSDAVTVRVKSNGNVVSRFEASAHRNDIGQRYPGYGSAHAFYVEVPLPAGAQEVCVVSNNVGPGKTKTLGCRAVTPLGGTPVGYINSWENVAGGIKVNGWAYDPDTTGPATIRVKAGDQAVGYFQATAYRKDLAERFPLYGGNHAFYQTVGLPKGTHHVCLVVNNVGAGKTKTLGCQWMTVR